MIIKSIELSNFRNYEHLEIHFDEKTNIIYGNNAQGKTNILEAAYVSGTTKSHKSSKDKEMIRFECEESHIKCVVEKDKKENIIDLHLKRNKNKGIAVNHVPLKKASDLFGMIHIIFFSPEDLNIIKNGPSERRRFIDSELCQLDKIYLSDLTNYNKILNQRNKLLKDINYHPQLKETLNVWDEQLIQYGRKIIKRRKEFILEVNEIVKEIHYKISGEKEILNVSYEPNIDDIFFADEIILNRNKDLKYGTTSVGPHRDDINMSIENIDIRKYGSQGQQRTCALSLKLSEIKLVEETIHDKPVLLLDDVLSELDSNRQNYLLNSLYDAQTIITCTGLDDFVKNRFQINKMFEVIEGKVFEKNTLEEINE